MCSDNYFNPGESDVTYESSNSKIYSVNIYVDNGIVYSTRKYKKLKNIIIDTISILSVIYSCFKKITKLLKYSITNKKVLELLFKK